MTTHLHDPFPAAVRDEVARAAALADALERRGLYVSFDRLGSERHEPALRRASGTLVRSLSADDLFDHAVLERASQTAVAA